MSKVLLGAVGVLVALVLGAVFFVFDQPAVGGNNDTSGVQTASNFDALAVKEFTEGGGVITVTPTSDSVTLTQAQMLNANVITFTASSTQEALTVTLPATSTLDKIIPNTGDTRKWVIENPFLAAATTTTIAAGSGIDLQEPDGQNVVIGIDNYAFLTCFRELSTDVVCLVDESIPAD